MRSSEITVLAQLRLHPDCIDPGLRDLLKFVRTVRRAERDCLSIEIVQDLDEPTQVTLIEKWTDRAAYEGPHLQTAHMKAFIENSGKYFDGPATISFGESFSAAPAKLRDVAPYGR